MIAKEMGFEYSDGELIRLVYMMYLDVLLYYYKFKTIQSKVYDKKVTNEKEVPGGMLDPRGSRSEGEDVERDAGEDARNDDSQEVAGNPMEHYALFTDNGWNEIKRRRIRRTFDFNRARAAVNEANASVLEYSRKLNHV
ncbi:hypothetical protein Hdeb2414_s0006g00225001 [Helianthus debilis subsp. tardiflorus]